MRLFKLKFHSALHVDARGSGEPEVAEEFVRSDTLSAALCIAWSTVYPDTGRDFFLNPPFKVGSAFPYVGDALFFPKPVWPVWETRNEAERKAMKKIRWISQGVLSRILEGDKIPMGSIARPEGNAVFSKEEAKTILALKKPPFWIVSERQRVVVDRVGLPSSGGLFFFALQFFGPSAGLWFLADADAENMEKLRSALDFLGDSGIGADRNSGLGHFTVVEETDFRLDANAKGGGWLTLSLFNPSADEIPARLVENAAYELTSRSGWISGTTVGRPPVRVFTEGSYFSEKPLGRVVETLDRETVERRALPVSHTAPRDLRAVCLPCSPPTYLKGGSR